MNKKNITIPCLDYLLSADWYGFKGSQKILLILVGLGSSKESNSEFAANIVAKTHMNAVVVDYSGHGESPFVLDEISPAQHLLETILVFDWIQTTYPTYKISVIGTSYGGFMAASLTRYRTFEKLVLRTPAIYEPKDLYSKHATIDKILVRTYRTNTEALTHHPVFLQKQVSNIPTLLIIHGDDQSIPPETTNMYKNNFNAETYVAKGFKHAMRDPSNPQKHFSEYYDVIVSWLIKKNTLSL